MAPSSIFFQKLVWYICQYVTPQRDYYCKRAILCLSSSKILTPHPPLGPASVFPLPVLGGRTHSPGGEGGWGSKFWRDIGLSSYSNNLSTRNTETAVDLQNIGPHVQCFLSGVKTHLGNLSPNSYLIRIRSSYHQAKTVRNSLISTIL